MRENERELRESLRAEIDAQVDRLLQSEQRFSGGNRYSGLDLPASALEQWQERPAISGGIEPVVPREDIRIILVDQIAKEVRARKRRFLKTVEEVTRTPAFKNIQLHIAPVGEAPRVRYVYNLILTEGKPAELSYYMDRPLGFSIGGGPAPLMPFGMSRTEADLGTLQVFNRFLDESKPL